MYIGTLRKKDYSALKHMSAAEVLKPYLATQSFDMGTALFILPYSILQHTGENQLLRAKSYFDNNEIDGLTVSPVCILNYNL